ncbi:MAG TPA: hypothetical protein VI504_10980 [Candidatus Eisenbacteria bacterium]|jgi:hypothetical protein
MLDEIFAAAEREARERLAPFEERHRAWRAYHQANSRALLDYLAARAERSMPTFRSHYREARERHGVA